MKNIFKIALSVVLLFTVTSCEDYLTKNKYGEPSSDTFWKTEDDAKRAADGLYFFFGDEGTFGQGFMAMYNCTDDCVTGRGEPGADRIKNFILSEDWDDRVNWPRMYQLIKKCNDIINNVPSMTISDNVKNMTLGQAYYFRAWAYMWIAPYYGDNGPNGGIPIITETMAPDEMDIKRPASVLSNYDYVIEGMKEAEKYLPYFSELSQDDYGRPHKAACWAYAAKAAMFASTYDATKYLPVVIDNCDKVINITGASKRALESDFANVYNVDHNYGSEYIWSCPSSATAGSMLPGIIFENTGWGKYNCWGYFNPTVELYDSFTNANDIYRRNNTILAPGDKFKFVDTDMIYGDRGTNAASGMLFRKFLDPYTRPEPRGVYINQSGAYPTTRLSIHLVRYAEVLLWRAEAAIRSGASGDVWFNEVHERAGLTAKSGVTMEDLMLERRHEFAGEGYVNRMLDLIRWGTAKNICEKPLHGYSTKVKDGVPKDSEGVSQIREGRADLDISTIQVWDARTFKPNINHVWPIPPSEVAKAKNLDQNIGY